MAKKYDKEYYKSLVPFKVNLTDKNATSCGYMIGFADKYYTLWFIHQNGEGITYDYRHNISMDEKFIEDIPLALDESLRGESRRHFTKYVKIYEPGVFNFGKYNGAKVNESIDISYLQWYCTTDDDVNSETCRARVMELDPDLYWDEETGIWDSKSNKSLREKFTEKVEAGEELELNLDDMYDGQISMWNFRFGFPHKTTGNSYYGYSTMIINPKTGKGMRTKNKHWTVTVHEYEKMEGGDPNWPTYTVKSYTINKVNSDKK